MNHVLRLALMVSSSFALAACGGGGGTGGGLVSTPAPAPAPTPSPSPAYTPVADLRVDATFAARGWTANNVDPDGDRIYEYEYYQFGPGYGNEVAYSPDGSTLELTYGTRTLSFDLSDPTGTAGERRYNSTDDLGGLLAQVLLTTPAVDGVELSYLDFASVAAMETDAEGRSTGLIAFRAGGVHGSSTRVEDLPTTGTASYSTSVTGIGTVVGGSTSYRFDDTASADFTVDFGSGDIDTTLRLVGAGLAGGSGTFDFGTLSGDGVMLTDSSSFSGDFGNSIYGRFQGGFFGPGGEEMGYAFFAQTSGWDARGFVAGTKD